MPDFEYDEDMEAGDEAIDEGSDEDVAFVAPEDIGVEGVDEALDEGDEAFGGGVGIPEDTEASDEADGEADEAIDEAFSMSASAQLRANAARERQDRWARRLAADQRIEAQRAAAVQRRITDQLRSIRSGGRPSVYSVGSLQGAGVVTAILPNGRQSRMRILPTMAPISEVNRLRSAITINDKRQAAATTGNSRAIAALASTQAAAVKKLTDQQVRSDKDLAKRIVESHNRLDRRITKELSGGSGVLDKHGKRMVRMLRQQRQRAIMNSVLIASAAPFFVAYGDRESPFTKNNAILAGSLLFWLTGDELIDVLGFKPGFVTSGATVWSYLAPFLNAGTVYYLLDDKQHERFVTGVTAVTTAGITIKAEQLVAKGSLDDFKAKKHNVVAAVVDGSASNITATIDADGNLTLKGTAAAKVAWVIDTQPAVEKAA